MKIGYYIRNYVLKDEYGRPAISGGVKVVSQHVKILNELGYETVLLTRNVQIDSDLTELNLYDQPIVVDEDEEIPDCDIYVATFFRDVEMLFQRGKGRVAISVKGMNPSILNPGLKGEWSRKNI